MIPQSAEREFNNIMSMLQGGFIWRYGEETTIHEAVIHICFTINSRKMINSPKGITLILSIHLFLSNNQNVYLSIIRV